MKIKKDQIKKVIIITFIAFLSLYFLRDILLKAADRFRLQGYEYAIMEMVRQAENENCIPFNVFAGDKQINLINIECLQVVDEGGYPMTGVISEDDFEGFFNDNE